MELLVDTNEYDSQWKPWNAMQELPAHQKIYHEIPLKNREPCDGLRCATPSGRGANYTGCGQQFDRCFFTSSFFGFTHRTERFRILILRHRMRVLSCIRGAKEFFVGAVRDRRYEGAEEKEEISASDTWWGENGQKKRIRRKRTLQQFFRRRRKHVVFPNETYNSFLQVNTFLALFLFFFGFQWNFFVRQPQSDIMASFLEFATLALKTFKLSHSTQCKSWTSCWGNITSYRKASFWSDYIAVSKPIVSRLK